MLEIENGKEIDGINTISLPNRMEWLFNNLIKK
jgi:hypothetical protein